LRDKHAFLPIATAATKIFFGSRKPFLSINRLNWVCRFSAAIAISLPQ